MGGEASSFIGGGEVGLGGTIAMARRGAGEDREGAASHGGGGWQVSDGGSEEAKGAERLRLETLREYRIMDTPPEPAFDRVAKMVAELYGVSIALVSLVAEDREWFKSAHGPDASETPRDIGLSRPVDRKSTRLASSNSGSVTLPLSSWK